MEWEEYDSFVGYQAVGTWRALIEGLQMWNCLVNLFMWQRISARCRESAVMRMWMAFRLGEGIWGETAESLCCYSWRWYSYRDFCKTSDRWTGVWYNVAPFSGTVYDLADDVCLYEARVWKSRKHLHHRRQQEQQSLRETSGTWLQAYYGYQEKWRNAE